MVSIISNIIIFGAVAVIILRMLTNSGLKLHNNRYVSVFLKDKAQKSGFDFNCLDLFYVFLLAFLFRIIVFLLSVLVIYMLNGSVNGFDGIMEQYMKWDANNYVRIATGGYTYFTVNGECSTLVFFPLYPWLMKLFNPIFRDYRLTGLILSSMLYSGGCSFLYALLAKDYNKSTAVRAIVYLSVFPHSLFFGTIMNESMLLITSVATLYYIRTHKWALVGIFGALAALSRMVGILLAIPAAVEWLEEYKICEKLKNRQFMEIWRLFYSKGLWIFLMLTGTGIYLFCNYKLTGDWFKFLYFQKKYWYHQNAYFATGISNLFKNAANAEHDLLESIWIPSISAIILMSGLLLYGLRRNKTMYSSYLLVYIIINMSVDYIISTPRYMTCAVPAFIFLADFSERRKWSEPIITASMAIGFGIYLVAYLTWHQIL